jgi:hypothetical protein
MAWTRELGRDERRLLDFLFTRDFPESAPLAAQAATARTRGFSCGCGCPSFSLVPDRGLPAANLPGLGLVIEAGGTDPAGNKVGVLLFADEDGYLSELELYSVEGPFGGLPDPAQLQLDPYRPDEPSSSSSSSRLGSTAR